MPQIRTFLISYHFYNAATSRICTYIIFKADYPISAFHETAVCCTLTYVIFICNYDPLGYNPIFDSKKAEKPLF